MRFLASVRLTVAILFGVIVLVFFGTLSQVNTGIFYVQQNYFRTFFIYWHSIPVFLGGYSFALLFLLNLIFGFVYHFRIKKEKIGIWLIHFGVAVLVINELVTAFFAQESQMPLKIGDSKDYSISLRELELAVIDKSHPDYDEVVTIPIHYLKSKRNINHDTLPFSFSVKEVYDNAKFYSANDSSESQATQGFGKQVIAVPIKNSVKDDQIDTAAVFLEIEDKGTWMFSNVMPMPQSVSYKGKKYDIVLRRKRHYLPFTLKLSHFIHESHPGTNIPSQFVSEVDVLDKNGELDRKATIYMNHPLRLQGKTFYQASFGDNDTLSVLQVVENPGRHLPYLSSLLVALGLFVQFTTSMRLFRKK